MADELMIAVAFDERRAEVVVGGELDLVSSPSLAGVLTALIDDGYPEVVVDLSALTFMEARGAGVFAQAAGRAASAGVTLILRATPAGSRRVLDITQVSSLLEYDATTLPPDLDIEGAGVRPTPVPSTDARDETRQTPMIRSSTDVVDAALRLVTALASATVDKADGVSVTLERHGRLMTVAATDDAVLRMDQHQYDTGEGPCLAARADGRWYYVESLADETRWPAFVPLALEQGIHSILSSPLMTHDRPQGALNIYSSTEKAFGSHEQELAALFAAQASEILTTADEGVPAEDSARRFTDALEARRAIHHAQGAIMARDGLTAEDAVASMIRTARSNDTTVLALAREIVASLHRDDASD